MIGTSTKATPSWLSKANEISYMESVYRILADREAKRQHARDASITAGAPAQSANNQSFRSLGFPRLRERNKSGHYSVAIAHYVENQHRNRYCDIEPYDRTRVVAGANEEGKKDETKNDSKYLNASWVLERFGHKWWIATQAPLPNTAHTFLSLFLQPITCPPLSLHGDSSTQHRATQLRTIVQLTQNFEGGRRKANSYFPREVGKSKLLVSDDPHFTSALKTTLLQSRTIETARCVHSTVSLVPIILKPSERQSYDSQVSRGSRHSDDDYGDDEREWGEESGNAVVFQHFLYTAWPDHGVPNEDDEHSLLPFIELVDSTNRDIATSREDNTGPDPDPPIVVGCSAGVGRTGSFIALSSLLRMYEHLPPAGSPGLTTDLPTSPLGSLPRSLRDDLVAVEVDSLREQRPGMVQRDEQLKLIYEMLTTAFE